MTRLVVFSGAGMSAESGISTFRDSNGLWENYDTTSSHSRSLEQRPGFSPTVYNDTP